MGDYIISRSPIPGRGTEYAVHYAHINNDRPVIVVRNSGDGCVQVHIKNGFLYGLCGACGPSQVEMLVEVLSEIVGKQRAAYEARKSDLAPAITSGWFAKVPAKSVGFVGAFRAEEMRARPKTLCGMPVAQTRGGFPIHKFDIDGVGESWVLLGPFDEITALGVAAKYGGSAHDGPIQYVGTHTDG